MWDLAKSSVFEAACLPTNSHELKIQNTVIQKGLTYIIHSIYLLKVVATMAEGMKMDIFIELIECDSHLLQKLTQSLCASVTICLFPRNKRFYTLIEK